MVGTYKKIPLSEISVGKICEIADIELSGTLRRRILDLGIIPGTKIRCIRRGPSGDPIAYTVWGTTIALRKEDSNLINVYPI